jgi:hypothetical protein
MYDKLTIALQSQLISHRYALHTLQDLCNVAGAIDTDLKRLQARKTEEASKRLQSRPSVQAPAAPTVPAQADRPKPTPTTCRRARRPRT